MFIVFEGLDGVGKTTQLNLLHEYLKQNHKVIITREPGAIEYCKPIRTMLLDKNAHWEHESELLLFIADRVEHWRKFIKPHLEAGYIVLCDRFKFSTTAYQGYGKGIDIKQITALHDTFLQDAEADQTFVFDMPVEMAMKRIQRESDRMEDTHDTFKERVRGGFLELAQTNKNAHIINADRDQKTIHNEITMILSPILS